MVDLECQFRKQRAQRIIRQTGEVNDGVEPGEVTGPQVADIAAHEGGRIGPRTETALFEKVAIETDHIVASSLQHRHEHGADISSAARHKYSHASSFRSGTL